VGSTSSARLIFRARQSWRRLVMASAESLIATAHTRASLSLVIAPTFPRHKQRLSNISMKRARIFGVSLLRRYCAAQFWQSNLFASNTRANSLIQHCNPTSNFLHILQRLWRHLKWKFRNLTATELRCGSQPDEPLRP
jgi:hypothetical protein